MLLINKLRNKFLLAAFFLISSLLNHNAYSKEKLIIVADYWCPYNCHPDSENEGYLVELTRTALQEYDVQIDYQIRPWNNSINDFNSGKVDGVFGASDTELSDPILPSLHQAMSRISAFTLKGEAWVYDGAISLEDRSIGYVEGYNYPRGLKSYIYTNYILKPEQFHFSYSANAVEENIGRLQQGTIYTYIEDENVVAHYAKTNNIDNMRHAGVVSSKPEKVYVAFSKLNPNSEKYAKRLSTAMLELEKNGKLFELKRKYDIKDYVQVAFISR